MSIAGAHQHFQGLHLNVQIAENLGQPIVHFSCDTIAFLGNGNRLYARGHAGVFQRNNRLVCQMIQPLRIGFGKGVLVVTSRNERTDGRSVQL